MIDPKFDMGGSEDPGRVEVKEKQDLLKHHTGTTWLAHGDGRWFPRHKWKSITIDGEPRHFKAYFAGEREATLKYFAYRVAEHIFGMSPVSAFELKDGEFTVKTNPEWDALPVVITNPETGREEMSDGSELEE